MTRSTSRRGQPSASAEPRSTWLSVREASVVLGVSAQTLRRWDRSGVLPAQRHPANNYRVYDETALREWIERQSPVTEPPSPVVPRAASALLGRADALEAIDSAIVTSGHRLVVVTGPPGVGKTSVVRAWMRDRTPAPVFCAAGDCRSLEDLALALGAALGEGIRAPTNEALALEVERAVTRAARLLVVDEIENLEDPALRLLARLTAHVQILATSRVRARLSMERVLVLPTLDFPAGRSVEDARTSSAVQLFVDRARAAGALENVDDDALREIAAIVRALEGLPLAVELAASRTPGLGLRRLRQQVEGGLDELRTQSVDTQSSHQTLRGAVLSSLARLSPASRQTLESAAMLPAGFELEELEELVDEGTATLEHVQTLVDHSMLATRPGAASTTLTFAIHAVVREVVLNQASPERRAALDERHAHWRAQQAAELAEDRSSAAILRITRAQDALARAWSWLMARSDEPSACNGAVDIARALGRTVEALGPSPNTIEILDRTASLARSAGVDASRQGELAFYRAFSQLARSALDEAQPLYEEALSLSRVGDNARFRALALCQLAWLSGRVGLARGEARLDEAAAVLEAHPDPYPDILISSLRGQFALQRGRLTGARRGFERARALSLRVGDRSNEASARGFLGAVSFDEGSPSEAIRHYDRAISISVAHGASIMEAVFRGYRAIALHRLGHADADRAYLDAIECARRAHSIRFESLFCGWRGVLLADGGEIEEATSSIDQALPDLQAQRVASLQRGHVDLALARRAVEAGALDDAQRHDALAARRLGAIPHDASILREVRVARAFLEDAIDARPTVGGSASVRVGWMGTWVEVGAERVALHNRGPLKRLVWELALRRVLEPGVPASVLDLVAATWSERIRPKSATHRVQVAVSTLRKAGLRTLLMSGEGGYLFDPEPTIRLVRAP